VSSLPRVVNRNNEELPNKFIFIGTTSIIINAATHRLFPFKSRQRVVEFTSSSNVLLNTVVHQKLHPSQNARYYYV